MCKKRLAYVKLNYNGYCAAEGSDVTQVKACVAGEDGEPNTNGFPIDTTIAFATLSTWPANILGVAQGIQNCDGTITADFISSTAAVLPACLSQDAITDEETYVSVLSALDATTACGKCMAGQLTANSADLSSFNGFADQGGWPPCEELEKAWSGNSPANPANTWKGCGGQWSYTCPSE